MSRMRTDNRPPAAGNALPVMVNVTGRAITMRRVTGTGRLKNITGETATTGPWRRGNHGFSADNAANQMVRSAWLMHIHIAVGLSRARGRRAKTKLRHFGATKEQKRMAGALERKKAGDSPRAG